MAVVISAFMIALLFMGGVETIGFRLARSSYLSILDDAIRASGSLIRQAFVPEGYATYLLIGPHVRLPRRTPGVTMLPAPAPDHWTSLPAWTLRVVRGHRHLARWATRAALRWRWYVETYVLDDRLLADWADLSLPPFAGATARHRPWSATARTVTRPYQWSWANEPTGAYATLHVGLDHADTPVAGTDRCWLSLVAHPHWMYLPLPIRMAAVPSMLDRLVERVDQVQSQLDQEEAWRVTHPGETPGQLTPQLLDCGPAALLRLAAAGPAQPRTRSDQGDTRATERPRPRRSPDPEPSRMGTKAHPRTAHAAGQLARIRPAGPAGHIT